MPKTIIIATREFRQRIRKRGFLLTSIGMPLVLLIIWAFTSGLGGSSPESTASTTLESSERPEQVIGYIDQADLIRTTPDPIPVDMFRQFPDLESAEAALTRDDIGAYYVISPDYRQTGHVRRISQRLAINPADVRWFNRLLETNLLPEADPDLVARLRQPFSPTGLEFVDISAEGRAEGQPENRQRPILPLLVTMVIIIPLFTSGSYLFQSLTQEKSNRVMEILLVSLRPRQLLMGKLLGLSALTLVQYVIWIVLGLLIMLVTGQDVSRFLSGLNLSTYEILLVIPFALGGFLLYAALMAGVGALARDVEDSRAWLFVISLPMMLPIYLWLVIANAPNGFLAVALSLIPFSAPVAMLMRITSTIVPAWQIGISLILLVLTGIGAIWLIARLFRVQTLLSGESISFRRFLAALQS